MAIEIKLPDLGDGIESGDILEVLVREGDAIAKDQGIVELETDKATVEVPSSHAGTVTKIHVSEGQSVGIGAVLVTLESADVEPPRPEKTDTGPEVVSQQPPAEVESPPRTSSSPAPSRPTTTPPRDVPTPFSPKDKPSRAPVAASVAPPQTPRHSELAPAGPAVRRFAREVGVDLTTVTGTGSGGRITRDDVLSVVRKAGQGNPTASTPAPAAPQAPETETPSDAAPSDAEQAPTVEEETRDNWGPIQVERMAKIRRTIAAKMYESWSTVPRVTNFDDADVTELERIRQSSKADYAAAGIKLTSMPFLIKSVALALQSNPLLNAAIDEEDEQIIYKRYVNVGIAVDTERGLVVPSLRNADDMSISDIARALAKMAEDVRNGSFQIDDLRGSTFTISNLGAIGGTYSTPIINTPEVGILLSGRSRKMPVVVDDEIVVRLMMPLSLSYDHRVVDGGTAARFLNDVIRHLEDPTRLLLAP